MLPNLFKCVNIFSPIFLQVLSCLHGALLHPPSQSCWQDHRIRGSSPYPRSSIVPGLLGLGEDPQPIWTLLTLISDVYQEASVCS